MPNLYNPLKFNIDSFLIEVGNQKYIPATAAILTPASDAMLFVSIKNHRNQIYFKLVNAINLLYGVIRLAEYSVLKKKYHVVDRVFTVEEHRHLGVAKFLYLNALSQGYKLMSDGTQTTPGSMDLWKNLILRNDRAVYIMNIETRSKRKYARQSDYEIWGKEANDDFDNLEVEDKLYLLDHMLSTNEISDRQYRYFIKNLTKLADKKNIRIIIE